MPAKICQYANCLEEVNEKGIVISLKTPTSYEEKRAIYCCAAHASLALIRLACDRKEIQTTIIQNDDGSKTEGIWIIPPRTWKVA